MTADARLQDLISRHSHRISGAPDDFDHLVDRLGAARIVLLGEASHGTDEFYRTRAQLTRRLIDEHGFGAVLVEADWPDAYRLHRYTQLTSDDPDAERALGDFERFPRWMWRNEPVVELVEWMRQRNANYPARRRAGFYGFDLYSLHRSMNAVVDYLSEIDSEAATRARERYSCFDMFGEDAQSYGHATGLAGKSGCEDQVLEQLIDLEEHRAQVLSQDGLFAEDEFFFAEQNARVAKNAEEYYRSMYRGRASSWNLRDQHMAETATAIINHLDSLNRPSKVVIWAHNSHLGDARATAMSRRGEHNVGQLLRQRYGDEVTNVGFTSHGGAVTAASRWGEHAQYMRIMPALDASFEGLFHRNPLDYFYLDLHADEELHAALAQPRLERAIGVIYRPRTERASHYFQARISEQFDWVIHLDITSALRPLDASTMWRDAFEIPEDLPETYPFGV
ncbi:MAG: erythromycin esterase family protein [Persicimonas sp.]